MKRSVEMKTIKITALLLAVLLVFALPGCGLLNGNSEPSASPEPSEGPSNEPSAQPSAQVSPEPSPEVSEEPSAQVSVPVSPTAQTMDIAVFYLKDKDDNMYLVREVHTVPKSEGVAMAALNELISGTPLTEGAIKVLPVDTKILGISIKDGLATVDFSEEVLSANVGSSGEALGITSIVNTLTEFSTIQKVQFTVEGSAEDAMGWWGHVGLQDQPFVRDLSAVEEPLIWVTTPKSNQKLTSPFGLRGTAIIFEATVNYRLTDSTGAVLAQGYTMTTAGAPERGDFEVAITFTRPPGAVSSKCLR